MRILALSPFDPESVSGNCVTLRRVQKALVARGHAFELFPVSRETSGPDVRAAANKFRPDVLHYYHAFKSGRLLASNPDLPSVVTISGTDLNHDYEIAERREEIDRALSMAGAVVTYNPSLAARVPGAIILPKGVTLGDRP